MLIIASNHKLTENVAFNRFYPNIHVNYNQEYVTEIIYIIVMWLRNKKKNQLPSVKRHIMLKHDIYHNS